MDPVVLTRLQEIVSRYSGVPSPNVIERAFLREFGHTLNEGRQQGVPLVDLEVQSLRGPVRGPHSGKEKVTILASKEREDF